MDVILNTIAKRIVVENKSGRCSEKRTEDRYRVTKGWKVKVHDVVRRHFEAAASKNMSKRTFKNVLRHIVAL